MTLPSSMLVVLLLLFSTVVYGQDNFVERTEPLVIGTKVAPPFVIQDKDGRYSGISIELWREFAQRLDLDYEFKALDLTGLISGLQAGELDASVAALTVTASREERIDFSHPFHTTGLAIGVQQQQGAVWHTVKRLFSWEFLLALAALGGILLLVGLVLWLVEHRKNRDMFGGTVAEGIGSSFWWAAVTMTTVGYGDKAPITFAGRVVALVWMFAAIIIISSFTAAIATSLTVSQLETSVQSVDDLPNVRVATVKGSASASFLRKHGIGYSSSDDLTALMKGLSQGRYEAVVYDKPILQYLANKEFPKRTQILPNTFERQDYAIALPEDSGLREQINRELLAIIGSDQWQQVLTRYLGAEE